MFHRLLRRRAAQPAHRRSSTRTLALERLEERCLLTTFNVLNTSDAGAGSLRQAILDANDNDGADKILFDASLSGKVIKINTDLPQITESLKVLNKNAKNVTVDGQDIAGVRPFHITTPDESVTLKKLTITGGNVVGGLEGGGIKVFQGDLKLVACVVTANSTEDDGGGIATLPEASLTITNSTVSNNTAGGLGGGIFSEDALNVVHSRIRGNVSQGSGGGLALVGANAFANVDETTIAANIAGGRGGGISCTEDSRVVVNESTIFGNRATLSGGGASIDLSNAFFSNSTIAYNFTDGGIGGGWFQVDSDVSSLHCTIVGNTDTSDASEGQGGIARFGTGGDLTLINTIVANNFAAPASSDNVDPNDLDTDNSNFIGDDARLGPLDNNGGPTQTMAPLEGSPVIDAGTNNPLPFVVPTFDQRLLPRLVNGTVDIGAVEVQDDEPLPLKAPRERRGSAEPRGVSSAAGSYDIDLAFAAAVLNQQRGAKRDAAARFEAFAELATQS